MHRHADSGHGGGRRGEGRRVRLEAATCTLPRSMYEPELFPGVVCRMPDPKCVILLFASGKLVCAGARSEADATGAVNQMALTLETKGLLVEKAAGQTAAA